MARLIYTGGNSVGYSRFTLAYLKFVWLRPHTVSILCTLYSSADQLWGRITQGVSRVGSPPAWIALD